MRNITHHRHFQPRRFIAGAGAILALLVALPEYRIRAHRCLLHTYEAAGELGRSRLEALAVLDAAKAPARVRDRVAHAKDAAEGLSIYREWGLEPANFLYAESELSAYAWARAYAVVGQIETYQPGVAR